MTSELVALPVAIALKQHAQRVVDNLGKSCCRGKEAIDIFKTAATDPALYNHGFDTWRGITHAQYNKAVEALLKQYANGAKLTANQARLFLDFLVDPKKTLPRVMKMTGEINIVRTWLKGFNLSVAHAVALKDLDPSIGTEDMKKFLRQMINDGKKIDDIPELASALGKARGLSKAARAARYLRIAGKIGPALAVLAILASTHEAVAGEGPLAERIKNDPVGVRIINQIGYDTMFGSEVEKYVFPRVQGVYDGVGHSFGIEQNPQNRAVLRRNGILVTPDIGLPP